MFVDDSYHLHMPIYCKVTIVCPRYM